MTGEPLTERDTEAIRLYVEESLTLKEVGSRLGVSPSTVWRILQKAGVSRKRKGPRWGRWTQRHEEIARAYREHGPALEEVGRLFGLSQWTVFYVLQQVGVTRRRPSRPSAVLAQRNEEITQTYVEEGLSVGQLAARFGVNESTVQRILKKAGVGRRARPSGPPEHLRQRNGEIAQLYAEGDLTFRQIGERFNLSHERVRQIARRAGVGPRVRGRPRVPREDVMERNAEIIRLYAEGWNLKAIGARVGLSRHGVSYVVRKAGVRRRRPGIGGRKPGIPLAPAEDRRKRNEAIVRLYVEERLTCREIGTQFGLTPHGVMSILDTAGVPGRSGSWRSGWPWRDVAQRNEEITQAYVKEGLSPKQVALRLGLSQGCVRQVLDRTGARRRPQDVVRDNQEIIRAYLEEGLTCREVASRFSVTPWRVRYILARADVRRKQPQAK